VIVIEDVSVPSAKVSDKLEKRNHSWKRFKKRMIRDRSFVVDLAMLVEKNSLCARELIYYPLLFTRYTLLENAFNENISL